VREVFGFKLYTIKPDEKQHFIIREVKVITTEKFKELVRGGTTKDALVFVHGFNTTFDESLHRIAQITWDLQFRGVSILFSWPSLGGVHNYAYDQNSALFSREQFLNLITMLRSEVGIENVHVIAHSMGNLVALDALANHAQTADPTRIGELIMAAPDVDRDHFRNIIPHIRKIVGGLTLYASSTDKALVAARQVARLPRAGDVPSEGPIVLPDMQTIDVTAIGDEILGLNHNVFAATRSLINDIKLLVERHLRPPHERLPEIRRVPEGSDQPRYWRYAQ
jgi:esterase/lipase superfamily enzyme